MSNDRDQEIRDALAMGPTPGPWRADGFEVMAARGQFYGGLILGADDVVVAQMVSAANAPLIAACDPDTIRELLAERDQLAAALEAAREDAERYRWLRRDARFAGWRMPRQPIPCPDRIAGCMVDHSGGELSGATLDAAIDQARGKGGQEVGS
jgi:hypothetical protein